MENFWRREKAILELIGEAENMGWAKMEAKITLIYLVRVASRPLNSFQQNER